MGCHVRSRLSGANSHSPSDLMSSFPSNWRRGVPLRRFPKYVFAASPIANWLEALLFCCKIYLPCWFGTCIFQFGEMDAKYGATIIRLAERGIENLRRKA
jgi:hypothetical protein